MIHGAPTKVEHKTKRLIRRLKELVKPTHASVRYDSTANKWAVLDKDSNPIRHFEHGVMTDVVFSTAKVEGQRVGCGGSSSSIVGIATGSLRQDTYGSDAIGYSNLSFDGHQFINDQGNLLTSAKSLRLLENRRALVK